MVTSPSEAAGRTPLANRILRAVREEPGVTKAEIADRCRCAPETASNVLGMLVGAGVIRRALAFDTRRGRYVSTYRVTRGR